MDKKTFALNAISPYYKDPSICGMDMGGSCANLTLDGKMCVAGKYLLPKVREANHTGMIAGIIAGAGGNQKEVFVPEAVDILTAREWGSLQVIHDKIAVKAPLEEIMDYIKQLNLFTYEEMIA